MTDMQGYPLFAMFLILLYFLLEPLFKPIHRCNQCDFASRDARALVLHERAKHVIDVE